MPLQSQLPSRALRRYFVIGLWVVACLVAALSAYAALSLDLTGVDADPILSDKIASTGVFVLGLLFAAFIWRSARDILLPLSLMTTGTFLVGPTTVTDLPQGANIPGKYVQWWWKSHPFACYTPGPSAGAITCEGIDIYHALPFGGDLKGRFGSLLVLPVQGRSLVMTSSLSSPEFCTEIFDDVDTAFMTSAPLGELEADPAGSKTRGTPVPRDQLLELMASEGVENGDRLCTSFTLRSTDANGQILDLDAQTLKYSAGSSEGTAIETRVIRFFRSPTGLFNRID